MSLDGLDEVGQQVVRAATEFIMENSERLSGLPEEAERAIIERDVTGTLAWLVTRWRSEGENVEQLGKNFIAATIETKAHLEDLVKMDEEETDEGR